MHQGVNLLSIMSVHITDRHYQFKIIRAFQHNNIVKACRLFSLIQYATYGSLNDNTKIIQCCNILLPDTIINPVISYFLHLKSTPH